MQAEIVERDLKIKDEKKNTFVSQVFTMNQRHRKVEFRADYECICFCKWHHLFSHTFGQQDFHQEDHHQIQM